MKKNKNNRIIIILSIIAAAVFIVATFYTVRKYFEDSYFKGISFNEKTISRDAFFENKQSVKNVRYELKNREVKVYIDDEVIFKTDDNYLVQDMFLADIEEDSDVNNMYNSRRFLNTSKDELVILLWKKGRYGIYRPFWVKEDEKGYSQHIFTYNLEKIVSKESDGDENNKDGLVTKEADKYRLHPKWGSSYIGDVYKEMEFKNGFLFLKNMDGEESAFRWISFGFEKVEDVRFIAAGDNLIHKSIYMDMINNHKGSFDSLYKEVKPIIKDADFSIINLETPVVADPADYSDYPRFGSPIEILDGIKDAGFTAVTLANNHIYDKGAKGVERTINELDKRDIIHFGVNDSKDYKLIKRNGIVFSLLNFTYGVNGLPGKEYENTFISLKNEGDVRRAIRAAKENSDAVLVFVHWGDEYSKEINNEQEYYTKVFYEEGVKLVVGTHPHVSQRYELYNDEMLIFYSIGNFISSNKDSEKNSGGLAEITFNITEKGVTIKDYDYLKINTVFKVNNE